MSSFLGCILGSISQWNFVMSVTKQLCLHLDIYLLRTLNSCCWTFRSRWKTESLMKLLNNPDENKQNTNNCNNKQNENICKHRKTTAKNTSKYCLCHFLFWPVCCCRKRMFEEVVSKPRKCQAHSEHVWCATDLNSVIVEKFRSWQPLD